VTLIYNAPNSTDLDNPDNITVTPRGGLLLCEDAAGNQFMEGERLIGLTMDGKTFTFGMNNINLTTAYNNASPLETTGRTSGPEPATALTAGGCLSISRHPESRSPSRDPGATVHSETHPKRKRSRSRWAWIAPASQLPPDGQSR
jgi:hypothetical protein